MKLHVSILLFATGAAWIGSVAAAGASLDGTGSGFYGVTQGPGPFNRATLSPLVTFDSATQSKTASLTANANQHDTSNLFLYSATLSGHGTVTYGAFTGSISFVLKAQPQTANTPTGPVNNDGHSELVSHINLSFDESGFVSSSTLSIGTPVVLRFIIVSHSVASISEPTHLENNNPHANGEYAGLDTGGYVTIFDENTNVELNGFTYLENHVTTFTLNTAVGHRVDLLAHYTMNGSGYAGLDGSHFFTTVEGSLMDASTRIYVQGPPGVSYAADSGHNYAPDTSVPRLLGNISTRGFVGTGNNVMIGGLIVRGTAPKQVILRALGPTLGQPPFNVPGVLANPVLELHAADGSLIRSNDNWTAASNAADIAASGYAPPNSAESAILISLSPGRYTAVLRGANNSTGVALLECYDIEGNNDSQLGNISTRGFVQTGDKVMIAGLVVQGPANENVIIRGLGPTLGQPPFNVLNVLADPFLDLRDANGDALMTNNNWASTQAAQIQASGYAPPNAAESAILITLPPGNYTAILSGVNNGTGNALVEVYALN
jgi:hypothetical protein